MILLPTRPGQREFGAALLDPALDVPRGLVAFNGSGIGPRLAMHRNNAMVSLASSPAPRG